MKKAITIFTILTFISSCKNDHGYMVQNQVDFKIIGISIESSNEGGQSIEDMGNLWRKFYSDGISDKIPNKTSDDVYSLFTDYESDYTGKYTAIIGHKVESLEKIPDGLVGREFKGGKYTKLTAKGRMPDAIVDIWKKVWREDKELNRRYTVDFEVYGLKSQNGAESEVDVFIATK